MSQSTPRDTTRGILHEVRVIDFTSSAAGPYATMLLADFGAEVVKVEPPTGDSLRAWGEWQVDNKSSAFLATNRNKRSVVLDLKSEEGRSHARALMADADIVIENFAPGSAGALGVTYEACKELNPRVIFCSVTGFGKTGPASGERGTDMAIQAYSGIMSFTGEPGRPPVRMAVSAIDLMTGSLAFGALVAALRERDASGKGQEVEVSLYDTAMNMLLWAVPQFAATGTMPQKWGGQFENLVPYGVFEVSDGYVFLGAMTSTHWGRLCRALDLPELEDDVRFRSNSDRVARRAELHEILEPIFATFSSERLVSLLRNAGLLASRIQDVGEAVTDDHAKERGIVRELPGYPGILVPATPIRLERGIVEEWEDPPDLGSHTDHYLGSAEVRWPC